MQAAIKCNFGAFFLQAIFAAKNTTYCFFYLEKIVVRTKILLIL
jgi:hypothetical protein